MRHLIEGNKELYRKINELEKKYDGQFRMVFDAIKSLFTKNISQGNESVF